MMFDAYNAFATATGALSNALAVITTVKIL